MRPCAIEGCTRAHLSRGWCATHYQRWWLYGSTDDPVKVTAVERFAALVAWDGEHLVWLGTTSKGYGRFWLEGKHTPAHRFLLAEPVPGGMQPDHLCGVTLCCLPDHLEVVTPGENTRRQARHRERTHCVNGHPYAGNRGTGRRCIICHRERMAARRGAHRGP